MRGAGAFVPSADLQRSFPLHGASHGGEAADEERGGFGANKFARNPTAFFLPAPSALNRPCFGFELRARADSPRFRGSLPLRGETTCGRSCGARCAAMPRQGH